MTEHDKGLLGALETWLPAPGRRVGAEIANCSAPKHDGPQERRAMLLEEAFVDEHPDAARAALERVRVADHRVLARHRAEVLPDTLERAVTEALAHLLASTRVVPSSARPASERSRRLFTSDHSAP